MAAAPAPPGLSARLVRQALAQLERLGVDARAACAAVSISEQELHSLEARIPYAKVDALLEHALALTADDNLGLHLAQLPVYDEEDVASLVILTSPTLGASLERGVKLQRLWSDTDRFSTEPTARGVRMQFRCAGPFRPAHRHLAEIAIAQLALGARVLTAAPVAPLAVRFAHPRPPDLREHEALFPCPILFDAPISDLELAQSDLERPLAHADALLHALLGKQAERLLSQLPSSSSWSDRVDQALRRALPSQTVSSATIAETLGVSLRSLQRHLAGESSSFEARLDVCRRTLAAEYLQRALSISEISFLLGYSEPAAFFRAFRRWHGTTPEAFRRARSSPSNAS